MSIKPISSALIYEYTCTHDWYSVSERLRDRHKQDSTIEFELRSEGSEIGHDVHVCT